MASLENKKKKEGEK